VEQIFFNKSSWRNDRGTKRNRESQLHWLFGSDKCLSGLQRCSVNIGYGIPNSWLITSLVAIVFSLVLVVLFVKYTVNFRCIKCMHVSGDSLIIENVSSLNYIYLPIPFGIFVVCDGISWIDLVTISKETHGNYAGYLACLLMKLWTHLQTSLYGLFITLISY